MAAVASIKLEGFKELEKRLRQLAPKVAKRELGKAVRAGGKPVVKAARVNVPVDTGELRASLGTKLKNYKHRDGGTSALFIGPREKAGKRVFGIPGEMPPSVYGWWVELGTVKMPPTRFLTRALEENKRPAVQAMGSKLRTGLEKLARQKAT